MFPKSDHRIINGYGDVSRPSPFQRVARRAWKQQAFTLLLTTPGADYVEAEYTGIMDDESTRRRFRLVNGKLVEVPKSVL